MKLSDYYEEHNYIHYSNCHEDFLLLKKYVKPEMRTILSVGSGLDNSLSFLVHDNVKVYAFDYNPSQVYLGKLKVEAIRNLSRQEYLEFLGVVWIGPERMTDLYRSFSHRLPHDVKDYFDSHQFLIEEGLAYCGRFEQYFLLFRNKVFPAVCREKDIQAFAGAETLEEQRAIYEKRINTLRFRLMFKIFFSRTMMGKLGRDKAFFRYSRENLPEILKKRVDSGFFNVLNRTNPYYGYVLNGGYKALPFYMQNDNFEKIKKNLDDITIEETTFDEMLVRKYDFMNLSDIFEYMDERFMPEYSEKVRDHLEPGGRAAFWNMMNVRTLKGMKRINGEQDCMEDRAFFYRDFLVYEN